MAEQKNDQINMVKVPADVLQSLLTEIANLRKESSETKKLLTSVQAKLNTILESNYPPPARGAFDAFPDLPIELRNKIWDAALSIPRIVGASLAVRDRNEEGKILAPTAPSSPMLFVNKESRARAKKILVCLNEKENQPQYRVPFLYIHPELDTLWIINYSPEQTRDTLISKAIFGGEKFSKLAIPFKTWNDVEYGHTEEEMVDWVIRIQSKGIKEVTLVIGEKKTANCSDIALIVPRELLGLDRRLEWPEDIVEDSGVEKLTWSENDRYASLLVASARDKCMMRAGLTRGTCQTKTSHLI
jgi:hypothetical protein